MRDVAAGTLARIELLEAAAGVAQQPLRPRPFRGFDALRQQDRQHVRNRTLFDHQGTVHIGFAESEFGIAQQAYLGAARREAHTYRDACAITKDKGSSARGSELERAPPDKRTEHTLKQPIHRPPPLSNRDPAAGNKFGYTTPRTHKRSDLGI